MEQVVDGDTISRANKCKEEGNELLSIGRYADAAEKYTEAIEINPTAIYYSNRAQALIKIESYGSAIADANEALKLDPSYIKSYYRRASANFVLGKLKEAVKDLKTVIKIVPKDPDAARKLKACEKLLFEQAFNKAIETNDNQVTLTLADVDSIIVSNSYDGPRLESINDISMGFVHEMISYFRDQKQLHKKYVLMLLLAARDMFKGLPSLIRIPLQVPSATNDDEFSVQKKESEGCVALPVLAARCADHITVCGDTHGQFYDLLNIFEIGGFPSAENPYLFNGDFVDRGSFSFETVTTLIALKLACPAALNMLRGNHETKNMNKIYGFEGEVKHKYDDGVMQVFSEVFSWLPLAAVLRDAVFVVHGGLSTQNGGRVSLEEIEQLSRNREPPEAGLMSDLLWADPQMMPGLSPSKRGLGFSFGPDYTEAFLQHNSLSLVVRSHEVKQDGYTVEHNGKCITVFSAPNYCDQMANKGAFIRFEAAADMRPKFTQFSAVPHPDVPAMRYAGNVFGL